LADQSAPRPKDHQAGAADLYTAHHSLNQLADGADEDTQNILYFMANHLEGIHAKLMREIEVLEDQKLKVVN
jgi:hypothetical protein